MSAFSKTLPCIVPSTPPAIEPRATMETADGCRLIVGETASDQFILVVDIPTAIEPAAGVSNQWTRRPLTPVIRRDQILAIAEAVMSNDARVKTWPHLVNVLAMGVALGLAPTPADAEEVVSRLRELDDLRRKALGEAARAAGLVESGALVAAVAEVATV